MSHYEQRSCSSGWYMLTLAKRHPVCEPKSNQRTQVEVLLYKRGNWDSERLYNTSKVGRLVSKERRPDPNPVPQPSTKSGAPCAARHTEWKNVCIWQRKIGPCVTGLCPGSSPDITEWSGQCHKPCPSAQSAPVGKISSALLQCCLEPRGKTHPGHSTTSPDPPSKGPSCTSLGPVMTHFALSCLWLLRSPLYYPERQFQRRSQDENASLHSIFLSPRAVHEAGWGACLPCQLWTGGRRLCRVI